MVGEKELFNNVFQLARKWSFVGLPTTARGRELRVQLGSIISVA